MMRRFKEYLFIFNYLGTLLALFGLLMLLPLLVQIYYREGAAGTQLMMAFIIPAAMLFSIGMLLQKKIPNRIPTVREGMVITALAWLLAAAVSSLPFIIGNGKPVVDALFEAASGITASGLTVFTGLDQLPRCLLFLAVAAAMGRGHRRPDFFPGRQFQGRQHFGRPLCRRGA